MTAAATEAAYSQRWDNALALLRDAAAAGDQAADEQLRALGDIRLDAWLDPPPKERLHEQSAIFACRGFLPAPACDWLIDRARGRLTPAFIKDFRTGELREDKTRTATSTLIERDVISAVVQERAARAIRVPVANHEPPSVISYDVGQKFDRHYDYVDPSEPASTVELLTLGQRIITVITYLNDDFEGGATDFPVLGLSFKGAKGDALLFSNVLANGQPDTNTLHAGTPPTAGKKWVLSQWIRNQALAQAW